MNNDFKMMFDISSNLSKLPFNSTLYSSDETSYFLLVVNYAPIALTVHGHFDLSGLAGH